MHDYIPSNTPNETPLVGNMPKKATTNINYSNSILLNSQPKINITPNTLKRNLTVPNGVKVVRFFDKLESYSDIRLNENYQNIGLNTINLYKPINLNERKGKHSYLSPSFQYVFIEKLLHAKLIDQSDANFLYNTHKSPKDKIKLLTKLMNSSDISIHTDITKNEINTMLSYWRSCIPIIKNSNQGKYAFQYDLANYIQTLNEAETEFNLTNLIQNCLLQGNTGIENFNNTKNLRFILGVLCDIRSDICKKYSEYLEYAINNLNIYLLIYPLYSYILNLYSCLFREHIKNSSVAQSFIELSLILKNEQNFNSDESNMLSKKLNHLKKMTLWFKSSYLTLIQINPDSDAMLNGIMDFVNKSLDMLNTQNEKC